MCSSDLVELDVYDPTTVELFHPDDFCDKSGEPQVLRESTVVHYLNKPKNRLLVEHALSSYNTFYHEQAPHMHRHAPEFSFSKISFDDRDLPRKLKDTKIRPKAYYAYDVASQAVVGFAYNRNKNVDLVVDMFRSMFRLITQKGWGCPAQVEVENHLMSQWKDSFLKAGEVFRFVRFCAPQNSQEKYAEPLNGAKKRAVEHRNHLGIGRFYAKSRAYRTESLKVFDALNDTYVEKSYYTWEELINEDIQDILQFNNMLHPNQKRWPSLTRWQVLEQNMNPTFEPVNLRDIVRYVGEQVETSVRRNSDCRVCGKDLWRSDTSVLEKLRPNDWSVDAYYIPTEAGDTGAVYIYQGDRYIDTLCDVGTYNSADVEQTDDDRAIYIAQRKKVARFNSYVDDEKIAGVGIAPSVPALADVEAVEISEPVADTDAEPMDEVPENWSEKALATL